MRLPVCTKLPGRSVAARGLAAFAFAATAIVPLSAWSGVWLGFGPPFPYYAAPPYDAYASPYAYAPPADYGYPAYPDPAAYPPAAASAAPAPAYTAPAGAPYGAPAYPAPVDGAYGAIPRSLAPDTTAYGTAAAPSDRTAYGTAAAPPTAPLYATPAPPQAPAAGTAAASQPRITYTGKPAFTNATGQPCRQYKTADNVFGTACRQSDGQWRVVD
ncbi:MAG: hypothetical protein JO258_11530 [Alphaproteobacteria bacterium]|nr:hypothetical protein [Alphaproteobacteria bacterium]